MIITDKDSPSKVFSTYGEALKYANNKYIVIEHMIIPFKMKDKMYWIVVEAVE